ncbi:MAG: hypothetical protein M1499_01780, partial [Firmicutes bacterium]|nr:hypothetical protein [Bacillota bacterium]
DITLDVNESGTRKVPEDALLEFVPNRWQKHVYDDGPINRHYSAHGFNLPFWSSHRLSKPSSTA